MGSVTVLPFFKFGRLARRTPRRSA
ncbi:unnamed protein product [Phyllotreta striolata]|uniref:Uncharacterized protein n=1 Tax=Phyllotreta striolata TaxID=444603 RepID=A0A9N9TXL1_PHYSR|nr:unnamed protein product [Phyllotreta striolata]